MKKIEIKGKLSLNKSTIANLNHNQMTMIKGGLDPNDTLNPIDEKGHTFLSMCADHCHTRKCEGSGADTVSCGKACGQP
jgi:hypothetical protein